VSGDVLVLLGLPTLLYAHGERARTLTLIGYVGVLVPLVVLNVGEGCIEAFVKPYFATHGGLLQHDLDGLAAFEAPALLILLIGMICLGIAVFRARVLPRWVGVAFILTPLLGVAGLSGAVSLLPDYLLFVSLFAVGVQTLRSGHRVEPVSATISKATATV
jgi:small-conductance mechanosensitive channel